MSKQLFELMAQQEIQTSNYLPSKKEVELNAKSFAKKLIDKGEIDKYESLAYFNRIASYTAIVKDEILQSLPQEKHISFGVEVSPVNGRTIINFSDDELWQQLKHKLQQREELLKVALKSDEPIFDNDGIEVPKVTINYGKNYFTVKY